MLASATADAVPEAPAATRIVGLGASAGGLDALEQFLAHVPPASGLAYIVVQHLDPTHKAMLTELLQRITLMPVREAQDAMPVLADSVYVIAPNSELTVHRGVLHMAQSLQPRGRRLPIDVLFCSLARDQGERAIGVVLSGMGADGSLGLQAIKAVGGITLAQAPESAQFDSMPRQAITGGFVDIVATPDELANRILQVVRAPASPRAAARRLDAAVGAEDNVLATILGLLRDRSKHDLSMYKPSVLTRRIERRVAVHSLGSMSEYAAFLLQNPQELDLLFKEMLIGVTSFFRDPLVWQQLEDRILPDLLQRAGAGAHLRAWVVGCSTGEEAYSLAIVFREIVADLDPALAPTLQIFATDLSADAIALARRGIYAARVVDEISAQRRARFFVAQGEAYVVAKDVREMVLFAQQDLLLDPPFTKLDMLSCRNLMIYFNGPLQRRLMPLFHYSLRPGGILLLGGSETIGRAQGLFAPLDLKSRCYQRSDGASSIASMNLSMQRHFAARTQAQETNVTPPNTPAPNLQALADQLILQKLAPATVLVNDQGDIIYISGRTGKYLEPAAGRANWNIHVMARPGIRTQVTSAMRTALEEQHDVELSGLSVENDAQLLVDITVRPLNEPKGLAGTMMVVFRERALPLTTKTKRRKSDAAADLVLSDELLRAQAEVRALRQTTRASEEELQAANEELQSTNEELQSANEELTTSKEEAQSMNEELQTINAELHSKLDDLALAQSDMQNLLNSTDIATLFLDSALNVRRFTEKMTRIIHLREGDIGRPLSELASTLNYPALHVDAKETLRTLAFSEKQIASSDGLWFSVRIMPYRTLANVIQGVVITFVDITATKELESRLRKG